MDTSLDYARQVLFIIHSGKANRGDSQQKVPASEFDQILGRKVRGSTYF